MVVVQSSINKINYQEEIAFSHDFILSKIDKLDLNILNYFFHEDNISISQTTAMFYFSEHSEKSIRTFYYRVQKLTRLGLLVHTHGKSPKYFSVTELGLSLEIQDPKNLKSLTNPITPNFTLDEKIPENGNGIANSMSNIAKSIENKGISLYDRFYSIFLMILHNFLVKIPIEINERNFSILEQLDSTFSLVAKNTNVRRYSKRLHINHPGGSYEAFVNIHPKSITVRLYNVYALNKDIAFAEAIDRVLAVLATVEKSLTPMTIQFAEISQWKFPARTGRVVQVECELANHPINKLFKEVIKFTKRTSHWKLIDEVGNKLGFDCSPRKQGNKIIKSPSLEFTGKEALEKTEIILEDMVYLANTGVGVKTLHEVCRGIRNQTFRNKQTIEKIESNQTELTETLQVLSENQYKLSSITEVQTTQIEETHVLLAENQRTLMKVLNHVFTKKESFFRKIGKKVKGAFS